MDIALLTANANQLRNSLELDIPYQPLLVSLFSLSIVLQIVASGLLLAERINSKRKDHPDYNISHRYI